MASPPHFMPGSGPQQFPNQSDNQNDEVVIYFQNYNNRPGGSVTHSSIPSLAPQHHHHHQHPNVRDINTSDPSPLNFALPPRPAGVSNEHEAAAYFLAQMGLSRDRELPPHMSVPHPGNRDIPLSPHGGGREQQHQGGNHMNNRALHVPVSTQAGNRDLHIPVSSHPNNHGLQMPPSTHPNSGSRQLHNVPVSTHTSHQDVTVRSQLANQDLPSRSQLINQDLPSRSQLINQDLPPSRSQLTNQDLHTRHQIPTQDLPGTSQLTHRDIPVTRVGSHAENQALSLNTHVTSHEPPITTQDNSVRNTDVGMGSQEEARNDTSDGEGVSAKPTSSSDTDDGKTGPLEAAPLDSDDDKPVPTLETRAMFEALMKPKRRLSPEEKVAYNRLKHPVRGACTCPRKCFEKITEKRRHDINYSFWGLSYVERAMFLMAHVKRSTINRKTVKGLSRRKFTLTYSLFDEEDHLIPVCKLHFLGTLGCQSDKVITRLFIKNPVGTLIPEDDMRGKHTPHNKIDVDVVKNHIITFCKQFAPTSKSKKLYVPPGITKMQMYNDFKVKFVEFKCGPTRYAQVVSDMNIVFGKKKAQPKPPKPSPSVDTQLPSTSQTYNDQQNQNQSFNRSSNFPIPMSQAPASQVIVYPGQTGRNLPAMGASMTWDQLDPQLYQGHPQFLNDPSLGTSDNRNSEQNQGFPGPCGMMIPPGFNLPGNSASQFLARNMDGTGRPNNPDGRPTPDGVSGRPTPEAVVGRPTPDGVTGRPNTDGAGGRLIQESAGRHNPIGAARPNLQGAGRPNLLGEGRNNLVGSITGQGSQHVTGPVQPSTSSTSQKASGVGSTSHKPKKTPRKRINKNQRNIPKRSKMIEDAKIAHRRLKYALLPPCNCPRQCTDKINEERRSLINYLFWGLQYHMRAMFLLNHIKQTVTKRCKNKDLSRRKYSRNYTLPDEKDNLQSVCKIFFLHTLGYTSDTVITKLLKKNPIGTVAPIADNRGRHEPPNKIDTSLVKEHVMAHQRRTSKGKLRLPPDISVKLMYADFKAKHSDFKCGYERYRQVVQEVRAKERKRADKS